MKEILWISRHEMTEEQVLDLERIFNDSIHLTKWKNTVHNVEEILPSVRQADAVAVVLPLELLAELMKQSHGKMILQSSAKRIATGQTKILLDGRKEEEFVFRHRCWQQIDRMELEVRDL